MKQVSKIFIYIGLFILLFTNLVRRDIKGDNMIMGVGIAVLLLLVGGLIWLFQTPKEQNTTNSKTNQPSNSHSENKQIKFIGICITVVGVIMFAISQFLKLTTTSDPSTIFYILFFTGHFLFLIGISVWWLGKRKI